jgi:hypothetical protein
MSLFSKEPIAPLLFTHYLPPSLTDLKYFITLTHYIENGLLWVTYLVIYLNLLLLCPSSSNYCSGQKTLSQATNTLIV